MKKYVKVLAEFDLEGRIIPKIVEWDDGKKFEVQKVLEARRAASLKAGGSGVRYRCIIESKERYLFLEDFEFACSVFGAKWFVESTE